MNDQLDKIVLAYVWQNQHENNTNTSFWTLWRRKNLAPAGNQTSAFQPVAIPIELPRLLSYYIICYNIRYHADYNNFNTFSQ
jgi:hypothetical protein